MLLAIETSCDETAAALVEKSGNRVRVLSNKVSSQIALHAPFGGVVPNLAAREHTRNIVPVIESALREAGVSQETVDAIAVTAGPGLAPALQIGVTAAKTLSYLWNKPLIPIHHIEGHIYANFLAPHNELPLSSPRKKSARSEIRFPLLALVVSGGHTELVLMRDHFNYKILGETEDDAVGEAFDKVAKMLGLPYPGGPEVDRRAREFLLHRQTGERKSIQHTVDQQTNTSDVSFPRPLLSEDGYRFSFSGLKTSVLYFLKKHEDKKSDELFISMVCYEFQEAALDVLLEKTRRAILEYRPNTTIIAGGVSANTELRKRMREMIEHDFPDTDFLMPPFEYSLDNAAMIGAAACFRWERLSDGEKEKALAIWQTLESYPAMELAELPSNRISITGI